MPIIKQGQMLKRAQGKSAFTFKKSWQMRLFVLNDQILQYYDGDDAKPEKMKGSIAVCTIKHVEPVDEDAFNRKFGMQIMHGDENLILYTVAADEADREDWLNKLRNCCRHNPSLQDRYHPGAFLSGSWTCCNSDTVGSWGCQEAFNYTPDANGQLRQARSPDLSRGRSLHGERVPGPRETRTSHVQLGATPITSSPRSSRAAGAAAAGEMVVVALYPYTAAAAEDLSFSEGDRLTIIGRPDENWWLARAENGAQGHIPSNYVAVCNSLESEEWYHGKMDRNAAASLLKAQGQDGSFLIRESESKPGDYSISLRQGDIIKHYHLQRTADGLFYVAEQHAFATVQELVGYHSRNSGGLVTRLKHPLMRSAPAPVGLGHDKWEIARKDLVIDKELGGGQFGVVYSGMAWGKVAVAIKMLKEGAMSEDDFLAEAQVMKAFSHPHLVQLLAVCSRERPLYIVTELCRNGCLLNYLKSGPGSRLSRDVLLYMGVQIASAMAYLESRQFIHRDLAARNVLVAEDNIMKVGDFGLARFVLDDEYTASEGTKFPIKWAAPEVISYARFSTKSDVWSFGVVLWEIFSRGRTPYPNLTNAEVLDGVVGGLRLECPAECPQDVYRLMRLCWEAQPESRPSFADLHRDLCALSD